MHTNGVTTDSPGRHELRPDKERGVPPGPAARLGIRDGDGVVVRAGKREQRGRAKVTEDILESTVFALHGWGRISPGLTRFKGKGIVANALMPATTEPVSGTLVMRETFVEVVRS